jgi:hypothetical protein
VQVFINRAFNMVREDTEILTVDDHAINSLKVWCEIAMKVLIEEHTEDPRKKVSELPSFIAAKAYEDRASHRLSVFTRFRR